MKNRSGMLTIDEYTTACSLTQIVSIDLLVKNKEGKYLLGYRKNTPAKNCYFAPGSRIFKGETIQDGLKRTMMDELGCNIIDIKFKGVYEHYYVNDNPGNEPNIDSHYVVLVYTGNLYDNFNEEQFNKQHSKSLWATENEILNSRIVHKFTKMYFDKKYQM